MSEVKRFWSFEKLNRRVCACCDVVSEVSDVKVHVLDVELLNRLRVRLKWLDGIHKEVKEGYSITCNSFPLLSDCPLSKKGVIVYLDSTGNEKVDVMICVKCWLSLRRKKVCVPKFAIANN